MKFNPSKTKRRLDRLFSKFILNKCNRVCERCGRSGIKIDCSHIINREHLALRWNPLNAVGLCVSCHKYGNGSWHKNPVAGYVWLETYIGSSRIHTLYSASLEPYVFNEQQAKTIEDGLISSGSIYTI